MFVQLSRSLSLMFTKVDPYNSADINRSLPRAAGQISIWGTTSELSGKVYRGSGFILLQIASARITRSNERNLCKVRLQTSLAFASLAVALLHLQKDFGRVKYFEKVQAWRIFPFNLPCMASARKPTSNGGMSGTSAKHLGELRCTVHTIFCEVYP